MNRRGLLLGFAFLVAGCGGSNNNTLANGEGAIITNSSRTVISLPQDVPSVERTYVDKSYSIRLADLKFSGTGFGDGTVSSGTGTIARYGVWFADEPAVQSDFVVTKSDHTEIGGTLAIPVSFLTEAEHEKPRRLIIYDRLLKRNVLFTVEAIVTLQFVTPLTS